MNPDSQFERSAGQSVIDPITVPMLNRLRGKIDRERPGLPLLQDARGIAASLLRNESHMKSTTRISDMNSLAKTAAAYEFLANTMKSGEGICGIGAESKAKFESKLKAFIHFVDNYSPVANDVACGQNFLQSAHTSASQPNAIAPGSSNINSGNSFGNLIQRFDRRAASSNIARGQSLLQPAHISASGPVNGNINSEDKFLKFIQQIDSNQEVGRSRKIEGWTELRKGKAIDVYDYKGFVFRSDSRGPKALKAVNGFQSRNNLNEPKHLQEAMGLGDAVGATGQSGVSAAKTVAGAISYLGNSGAAARAVEDVNHAYLYILDSNGVPNFDLGPVANQASGRDETGGEVNLAHCPMQNIVGWIKVPLTDCEKLVSQEVALAGC